MAWRIGFGVFLILHGLIHPAIYGPPPSPDAPWETARSWVLARLGPGHRRRIAVTLSVATAVAYLVAGVALFVAAPWWTTAAIVASVLSLLLLGAYFHPWLSLGVVLDVAVIWVAVAGWPLTP